uniref:Gypsy retrotransposon integrase-like protein 1 n=1 Tax=Ciona intestinalis TaxID=7719 RepID=H2XY55_CIOIN
GARNSPQTFCRLMAECLHGLKNVFSYVDDILVASETPEQHLTDLKQLFERLDYGLIINADKCVFGADSVLFLGHIVNNKGISVLPDRIDAIDKLPPKPKTVLELQRFLGMINYFRSFCPNMATILAPLTSMLGKSAKTKKCSKILVWDEVSKNAFNKARRVLRESCCLAVPRLNAPTYLTTDASSVLGAVLSQKIDGELKPLAFYSKLLTPYEDAELLAIYRAVGHFRSDLLGRNVTVLTDHKLLVRGFSADSSNMSHRHIRHFSNEYLKGSENKAADYLSRLNACVVNIPDDAIDYKAMAEVQSMDQELHELKDLKRYQVFSSKYIPERRFPLIGDVSTGIFRPFVPCTMRKNLHQLSHPKVRPTKFVSTRFVWPGMRQDISKYCRNCICQKCKIGRHTISPLKRYVPPTDRFSAINIDNVGPFLPMSHGYQYLLTIIDRFTRFFQAIPIKDMKSETCILLQAILYNWIALFGVPIEISADRGKSFDSISWNTMCTKLGINMIRTTSYHPSANGAIEGVHRLKTSLMCYDNPSDWYLYLPFVLLSFRAALKEDLGCCSSSKLVFGKTMRLPGEFFDDDVQTEPLNAEFAKKLTHALTKVRYTKTRLPANRPVYVDKSLHDATDVFVREERLQPELTPTYFGPVFVLKKNEKFFTLAMPHGTDNVAIDRLKAAHLASHTSTLNNTPSPLIAPAATVLNRHDDGTNGITGRRVKRPAYLEDFEA